MARKPNEVVTYEIIVDGDLYITVHSYHEAKQECSRLQRENPARTVRFKRVLS